MMDENAPLDARPERGSKGNAMDVSNVSSVPSSNETDNRPAYEKGVAHKRHRMRSMRRLLNRDLKPTAEEENSEVSPKWLNHKLSLRRPSGKRKKEKNEIPTDVTGGGSQSEVGTGSTRQQLPDHVLNDSFDVPEFDCNKLNQDEMHQVGKGSQAIIYATSHDHVLMALKVLRPELASDEIEHETFEREVNLLARLAHPNINSVFGIGLYKSMPCALLEWCPSDITRTLRLRQVDADHSTKTRTAVKKQFPASRRLQFIFQLASAMAYLHSGHALPRCFVLHRDIKPDNLGVAEDNSLKLLDFGLACCLSSDDSEVEAMLGADATKGNGLGSSLDTTIIRRGKAYHAVYDLTTATGSPRYMANEVGRGRKYGLKADIYSFAIVSWEILILARPYGGLSPNDLERRVWGMGLRPQCPRSWHPKLVSLFNSMWHADPDVRPPFDSIVHSFEGF